jgi:hypothetical protein
MFLKKGYYCSLVPFYPVCLLPTGLSPVTFLWFSSVPLNRFSISDLTSHALDISASGETQYDYC